jgi:hypothetical protein
MQEDDFQLFEGPAHLAADARRSIDEITQRIEDFAKVCKAEPVIRDDRSTNERVLCLRFSDRLPPPIRVLAGRILNDLRHSLDQTVCDAARLFGADNQSKTYFPIEGTEADLLRSVKSKCKLLPAELVAHLVDLRPFKGGNDELWALSAIAAKNKHQRLVHLAMNAATSYVRLEPVHGPASVKFRRWNDIRNELEFMRVGLGGDADVSYQIQVSVCLATDLEVVGGRDLVQALNGFYDLVVRVQASVKQEALRIADS